MNGDERITLSNLHHGRLEANFQKALEELRTYCEDHNQDCGALTGKIVLTIEIKGVRDEPTERGRNGDILHYNFTAKFPKVTYPERMGITQRVRKDGESLVVDPQELDADRTRSLFRIAEPQ